MCVTFEYFNTHVVKVDHLIWFSQQLIRANNNPWMKLTFCFWNEPLSNPWLTRRKIDYSMQHMAYTAFNQLPDHIYIRNAPCDLWPVQQSRNQMN